MNKKQKILLIIVSFILFLMLLFPPWHYDLQAVTFDAGYHFILSPPKGNSSINIAMVLVQYLFTATIGGILYYIFKDKDKNAKNDEMH